MDLTRLLLSAWLLWKGSGNDLSLQARLHATQAADRSPEANSPLGRVCVLQPQPHQQDKFSQVANDVASQLSLAILSQDDLLQMEPSCVPPLGLVVVENGDDYVLALQSLAEQPRKLRRGKNKKDNKTALTFSTKPLWIDFLSSQSSSLSLRGNNNNDLLLKAVKPTGSCVWDLTTGWGQDAMILARAGAVHVHMVERDNIMAALLMDALRRLERYSSSSSSSSQDENLFSRLSFQHGEGIQIVQAFLKEQRQQQKQQRQQHLPPRPDIVYLDPMFPTRQKSAAVKKNMQLLHGLLDTQQQEEVTMNKTQQQERLDQEQALLRAALTIARRKVVVKRPIHAPTLGATTNAGDYVQEKNSDELLLRLPKPSYDIRGSINRWDIYVTHTGTQVMENS